MATDLETGNQQGEVAPLRPSLKITRLHIKGLKSIGSLDLPEDGLGWDGAIPDFVMVGGINGSGKTTLLEFVAKAFSLMPQMSFPGSEQTSSLNPNGQAVDLIPEIFATEAMIEFWFPIPGAGYFPIRFLIGDKEYIRTNATGTWFGFQYLDGVAVQWENVMCEPNNILKMFCYYVQPRVTGYDYVLAPSVVYFPSERRTLISPTTNFKSAGRLQRWFEFVNRWKPPEDWDASLEATLYGVRWEDLNAREEGRDREANGFDAYSRAFDRFFEGKKRLKWRHAELVVETKSGAFHDLSGLSSGEKQVILFMGELLHRWHPGSLILIDEPELHLHEWYQTKLWEALLDWQKERGGQVIVATQSGHLFGLSGLGTRVILSSRKSR